MNFKVKFVALKFLLNAKFIPNHPLSQGKIVAKTHLLKKNNKKPTDLTLWVAYL